eukprot:gene7369-15049_t
MAFIISTALLVNTGYLGRSFNISLSSFPTFQALEVISSTSRNADLRTVECNGWTCLSKFPLSTSSNNYRDFCKGLFDERVKSNYKYESICVSESKKKIALTSNQNGDDWYIDLNISSGSLFISNADESIHGYPCRQYSFQNKIILFDMNIFLRYNHQIAMFPTQNYWPATEKICSHIRRSFSSTSTSTSTPFAYTSLPFTLLSGYGSHTLSLEYWFDLCGIHPIVIYTRDIVNVSSAITHNRHSECTVIRVTGAGIGADTDTSHTGHSRTGSPSNPLSSSLSSNGLLCVEDVLTSLNTDTNTNRAEILTYITPGAFVSTTTTTTDSHTPPPPSKSTSTSSLYKWPSSSSSSLSTLCREDLNIHRILRAFENIPGEKGEGAVAMDEKEWNSALSALKQLLEDMNREGEGEGNDVTEDGHADWDWNWLVLFVALNDYLVTYEGSLCIRGVTADTETDTDTIYNNFDRDYDFNVNFNFNLDSHILPSSSSYFCSQPYVTTNDLGLLLITHTSHCTARNSHKHSYKHPYSGLVSGCVMVKELGLVLLHTPTPITTSPSPSSLYTHHDSVSDPPSPIPPAIDNLSTAYVVLLICPHELRATQRLVQRWRTEGPCDTCSFYAKYSIVLSSGHETRCSTSSSSLSSLSSKFLQQQQRVPSFRTALLTLEDWIERVVVGSDIVILLHGLQAAKGFTPPGTANSIIPWGEYGKLARYRLDASIVIGCDGDRNGNSNSDGNHHRNGYRGRCTQDSVSGWDLGSVAGVGYVLREMLTYVRNHDLYAMSEAGARRAFFDFCKTHPSLFALDKNNKYFSAMRYNEYDDDNFFGYDNTEQEEVETDVQRMGEVMGPTGTVDTGKLQTVMNAISKGIAEDSWLLPLQRTLRLHSLLIHTSFAWIPSYYAFLMGANVFKKTRYLNIREKVAIITLLLSRLEEMKRKCTDGGLCHHDVPMAFSAVGLATAAFLQDVGPVEYAVDITQVSSLSVSTYLEVEVARTAWKSQRRQLSKTSTGVHKVHYVTVASKETVELSHLHMSADMAGIELT